MPGGECDRPLTACAREGAGGRTDLAACCDYCGNEAESFELFFLALRW